MDSLFAKVTSYLEDPATIAKAVSMGFSKFDTDGSGFIEKGELNQVLEAVTGTLGLSKMLPTSAIDAVFAKAAGEDGKVSKEEFTQLVTDLLHKTLDHKAAGEGAA